MSLTNMLKGLTPRQKKTMRKHKKHHTLKHMRAMATAMKKDDYKKLIEKEKNA